MRTPGAVIAQGEPRTTTLCIFDKLKDEAIGHYQIDVLEDRAGIVGKLVESRTLYAQEGRVAILGGRFGPLRVIGAKRGILIPYPHSHDVAVKLVRRLDVPNGDSDVMETIHWGL